MLKDKPTFVVRVWYDERDDAHATCSEGVDAGGSAGGAREGRELRLGVTTIQTIGVNL